MRDGKRVNFIAACDVYEFNDKNELERISSYCIPDKKQKRTANNGTIKNEGKK